MTNPAHSVEGPLHLKIIASLPANVELSTFQGHVAVRFRDHATKITQQLEELGHAIATVTSAQAEVGIESLNERMLLVPDEGRWLFVCKLPSAMSNAKEFVQGVLNELRDAPGNPSTGIDPARFNPAASKEMERVKNTLLRKHGGDPIPECSVVLDDQVLSCVRGTYRPKPNQTDLVQTEEAFEGIVSGYNGPPREANLTLKKEGSLKEKHRKAHWVDDVLGDKIASLATPPSRTVEIRVAGIFGVTKDAKGNSVYEVKAIWRN